MIDYILIVSLALLAIGIALFIALPFCRMADDGDDEHTGRTLTALPELIKLSDDEIAKIDEQAEHLLIVNTGPTEPTPLECAEARTAMGEPIASAARNEGVPLTKLMNYLRAKECQPTK